LLSLLAAM